ncbi:hypothetical protein BDV36DRAFT_264935 [Aspergillus pseudocaelatus]|uniref:Uncharacterized protein n=1 Tax=Aspergillus pseudocaelatus TaxID=1825620 RepID=A0ABQ6WC58_9EURO|nr:hypothetical protein BDV36DRAFT_264935 [Aspergillus pseudocaelatus]
MFFRMLAATRCPKPLATALREWSPDEPDTKVIFSITRKTLVHRLVNRPTGRSSQYKFPDFFHPHSHRTEYKGYIFLLFPLVIYYLKIIQAIWDGKIL